MTTLDPRTASPQRVFIGKNPDKSSAVTLAYLLTGLPGGVAVAGDDHHTEARASTSFANPAAWREIGYALLWATVLPAVNGLVISLAAWPVFSYTSALPSGGSPLVVLLTVVVVLGGLESASHGAGGRARPCEDAELGASPMNVDTTATTTATPTVHLHL
ncbi:hypothetical protein ACNF49_40820 [Actinomadura sp. ATCC 39365]